MGKIIIVLLISLVFLMSSVSAENFEIELKPHYYIDGKETVIYGGMIFDGISFEVIGKNLDDKNRILNLSIIDSYPLELKKGLPLDIVEMLRIKQEKTLWISQIIDINKFDRTNISFWVGVEGVHEKTSEVLYSEGHLNIIISNKTEENSGLFLSIGDKVWEDNPSRGLLIVLMVIIIVGFSYWKHKGTEKLNKWRDKVERKKIERMKFERSGDERI